MNTPALLFKALHLIFVITWFAGLFYIVRLFIYHTESEQQPEPEKSILQNQYRLMESRLWYAITVPSMVLTLISGFSLVYLYNYWLQPWMLLKFALVGGLIVYHVSCGVLLGQLKKGVFKHSSLKLRFFNEIATVLLVAVVFVIVFKDALDWWWGSVGITGLILMLWLTIRAFFTKGNKKSN